MKGLRDVRLHAVEDLASNLDRRDDGRKTFVEEYNILQGEESGGET